MKKLACLILTIAVLQFGCEKQETTVDLKKQLIGEWEFIKAQGGFTGNQIILPPAGVRTILIFDNQRQYKRNVNGETVEQEIFDLIKVNSIFTSKPEHALTLTGASADHSRLISIRNDSLYLTDNHVEPYAYLYIRKK